MSKDRRPLFRIFRIPLALFVLSLIGLIAALLTEKSGDVIAALCVAAPVATVIFAILARKR